MYPGLKGQKEDRSMDQLDKDLLNLIQSNFPISPEPFKEIGEVLGISEEEVIERVKRLKENGIIRRIGASLNSQALGHTSTLLGAKVPEERLESFVEEVNKYPGVTHNYLRDHDYNVWFTFIAKDRATIDKALEEIKGRSQVQDILDLPAIRLFKVKVDFDIE